jgi:hypothetical protein
MCQICLYGVIWFFYAFGTNVNTPYSHMNQLRLPLTNNKHWIEIKDGDPDAFQLYYRHYSARHYKDGRTHKLFVGPGYKLVLITPECDALFVWRKFISLDN